MRQNSCRDRFSIGSEMGLLAQLT